MYASLGMAEITPAARQVAYVMPVSSALSYVEPLRFRHRRESSASCDRRKWACEKHMPLPLLPSAHPGAPGWAHMAQSRHRTGEIKGWVAHGAFERADRAVCTEVSGYPAAVATIASAAADKCIRRSMATVLSLTASYRLVLLAESRPASLRHGRTLRTPACCVGQGRERLMGG
jgi:hypothetical protein